MEGCIAGVSMNKGLNDVIKMVRMSSESHADAIGANLGGGRDRNRVDRNGVLRVPGDRRRVLQDEWNI